MTEDVEDNLNKNANIIVNDAGDEDDLPTNTNMFGEEISEEETKIIDFINERELYYESEARAQIVAEVKEKFGDTGTTVLNQLTEDTHFGPQDVGDCEDCGKASKEWAADAQEKIKYIEMFLDNEYKDVVSHVIQNSSGRKITTQIIEDAILSCTPLKETDITDELINKIKIKIVFTGIIEGWLLDEIFE